MKIFGREPAVIVGFLEAVLVLFLSFGAFDLTQETVGLIMAVVAAVVGVYVAYVTSETLLGAVVGLIKAAVALGAVYGLTLSLEETTSLIAVVTVGFGMWQRDRTTPLETPSMAT